MFCCRVHQRPLNRLLPGLGAVIAAIAIAGPAIASPGQDYMLYCMGCHGAQAQGVPGKIPPLAHALGRYMRSPLGRDYVLRVPGAANSVLSDAQFDASDLSGDVPWFTTEEVTRSRHTPLADVLSTRREVVRALAASGDAPAADY